MTTETMTDNPLLQPWTGEYGLPPFAQVRAEHFAPAFERGDARPPRRDRRASATRASRRPSTTPWPRSTAPAACSTRVGGAVLQPRPRARPRRRCRRCEREMAPLLAAHDSARLHARARCSRASTRCTTGADALGLDAEQRRVLERYHTRLRARRRARWTARRRSATREVMQRLAELTTALRPERARRRVAASAWCCAARPTSPACRTSCAPRRGRPRASAASPTAAVITLSRSHIVPFLTFSERRDLREQAWRAWTSRGEHRRRERQPRRSPPRSSRCASSRPALHGHAELCRLRARRHHGRARRRR